VHAAGLPERLRGPAGGVYSRRIMQGLFSLALPTVMRAAKRSRSSSGPRKTLHFRPCWRASFWAWAAIQSGVAILGGVSLRVRAKLADSAGARPRPTPDSDGA